MQAVNLQQQTQAKSNNYPVGSASKYCTVDDTYPQQPQFQNPQEEWVMLSHAGFPLSAVEAPSRTVREHRSS